MREALKVLRRLSLRFRARLTIWAGSPRPLAAPCRGSSCSGNGLASGARMASAGIWVLSLVRDWPSSTRAGAALNSSIDSGELPTAAFFKGRWRVFLRFGIARSSCSILLLPLISSLPCCTERLAALYEDTGGTNGDCNKKPPEFRPL